MGNCGEKNTTGGLQEQNQTGAFPSNQYDEQQNKQDLQQSPVKQGNVSQEPIQHLPDMQGLEKLSPEELQARFVYSSQQQQTIKSLPVFEYENDDQHHNKNSTDHPAFYVKSIDSIYEGSWFEGKPSGKGKMRYQNGNIYEGYWKNGIRSGYGRLLFLNGNFYQGEWNEDNINGKGKLQDLVNRITYEGTWKNGQLNGLGQEEHQPQNRETVSIISYKGDYVNGKKQGKGELIYSDSSKYVGDFQNDAIQGSGTFKWADKRVYVGQFHQNKMNGIGTTTWEDGTKYSGGYLNDLKHGYGEFQWSDKRVYKGNWIEGVQEGYGFLINNDNVSRKCEFKSGKFVSWLQDDEDIEEKNKAVLAKWEILQKEKQQNAAAAHVQSLNHGVVEQKQKLN